MADPLNPSPLFTPLFSSAPMRAVVEDAARVQRMLDFEAALARAEAAVGVIPAIAAGEIADACRVERYDLAALAQNAGTVGNVVAPLVDALAAEVAKRDRNAAGYVHWGATVQDVIDTALVLELRAAIDVLFEDLDRATKAFTTLAGRHRRTMTVERNQLRHALPVPLGLKLAGYAAALSRSRDRLRRLRREVLALQFGGGAGTLALLGEHGLNVSERLAALLDLPLPDAPWHGHRDRLAEIAATLGILAGTCGKIARDVALMMQGEMGEALQPVPGGRGGKRNPTAATAALSAAMIAPNLAAGILSAQTQDHEHAVGGWQSEWATFPALLLVVSGTLHAVAEIAEGLEVNVERMRANLEQSGVQIVAEAVSVALAEKMGKAEAQKLVTEISQQAEREKRVFRDLVAASAQVKRHLDATEMERLFLPGSYQGAAQTFIDRLVASAQGRAIRRAPKEDAPPPRVEPKLPLAATMATVSSAVAELKALRPGEAARAEETVRPPEPARPVEPVRAPEPVAVAPAEAPPLPPAATEEPSPLMEIFAQVDEPASEESPDSERKSA